MCLVIVLVCSRRAIHRVYVRCAFVGFQCYACAPLPFTPPKENAHGKKIRARRIADVLYTATVCRALEIHVYMYITRISNRTSCCRTYIQLPQKKGLFTHMCDNSQQKTIYINIIQISAPI